MQYKLASKKNIILKAEVFVGLCDIAGMDDISTSALDGKERILWRNSKKWVRLRGRYYPIIWEHEHEHKNTNEHDLVSSDFPY